MDSCVTHNAGGTEDSMHGGSDPEFNALIAESQLWLLARCGHVPMLERPVPFNRVVADWLELTRLERERPVRLAGAGR
jgi:pimeloyl-ACP methyl ester carboxylesterase